ncbi:ATP-binding protein [Lacinutrix neustonica]|uniref:histidine kinase n=1 Tax=Lacinutrix neustonica TaxID=2980107 RepID=A0A9E8MZN3_9FLAO|nr:ATP-binding protein [Lacinutrix neustonica]WAC03931.1 ATP-binding protein [Lacinutrix neustonica]
MSNAVKYGSPRHPITISAKNTNNAVEIRVHNHGNSIPKGKQKQVFEFLGQDNQDKNAVRKSWGMGLALAQIVAEAHGGNISLKSDEASGTLFVVSLLKDFNQSGKRRTKLTFVEEKVLT